LSDSIDKVLIVGSGWVGRQLAARMAAFGVAVGLTDKSPSVVQDAMLWMSQCGSTAEALTVGQVHDQTSTKDLVGDAVPDPDTASSSSFPGLHLIQPLPAIDQMTRELLTDWGPQLVIECVPEQLSLKKRVLRRICELVPEDCIVASNSSYFVPSVLSQFVSRPERFAHIHFHVPVLRESVADIVGCDATDPKILQSLSELCRRIQQYPLVLKREHPGYVFNWLLQAVLKAALELAALDVADIEEIDRSWKSVTGMPVGPFGMMDQIGLDVIDQVLSNSRWAEASQVDTGRLLAVLRPLIQNGRLGAKSGSGFYDYREPTV
jgi:3-hydroxybutyryl-CoA dehydrogenase